MSEKPVVAAAAAITIVVLNQSGKAIEGAKVVADWDDSSNAFDEIPDTTEVLTNAKGEAALTVPDPEIWLDASGVTGTITASKRHHGPVVADGQAFRNGPATVQIKFNKAGAKPLEVLTPPFNPDLVKWGRPRIDKKKPTRLEVTLVEGGTLGREHTAVPTRRLSSIELPAAPPTVISQVDEELIFRIAHGDISLTPESDFKFEHDASIGDFDPCEAGKCKVKPRPATPGTLDPTFSTQESAAPYVGKLSVRKNAVGGVRLLSLVDFPGSNFVFNRLEMHSINPRNLVGMIRLCRFVNARGIRMVYSNGVLRYKDGKLKTDAHGRGRGFDLGGFSTVHPDIEEPSDPNSLVTSTTRTPVAEVDFIVFFHWGIVKMLVDVTTNRRRSEDGASYRNDRDAVPTGDRLLYRLGELPAAADRHSSHVLTDAHYQRAGTLFQEVYTFLAGEYSFREVALGPNAPVDSDPVPAIGSFSGFLLHPDLPNPNSPGAKDGRQAHVNHFHFNLGRNSAGAAGAAGTYER